MKHPATRELFRYWTRRRGLRAAPERAEIDPGHLKSLLPDAFVLSFEVATGHPFRIAGSRLCSLVGRELRGTPFAALWDDPAHVHALLDTVAHEAVGIVAAARATIDDEPLELEILVLPLSHGGRMPARFIGTLAPFAAPSWSGWRPTPLLTLGMHRHLGAEADMALRRLVFGTADHAPARVRPRLTVIAGGRA